MTTLYSFHPLADEQQTNIWVYTCERWGIEQADKYIDGSHEKLSKISLSLYPLRKLPKKIANDVEFFRYDHHYVFVQWSTAKRLQVLTILHETMDIPLRLRDIFERL